MKTKEQVKEFLLNRGFTRHATNKIMGFLIGAGIKEEAEVFAHKIGDGTFEDFYAWFTSETKETECPLCGLIGYLFDELEIVEDEEKAGRLYEYISFLIESFDLEVEETEDSIEIECSCDNCKLK